MNESKKELAEQIEIRKAKPEDAKDIAYVQRDAWLQTYPNEKAGITREDIEDRYSDMAARVLKWEKNIAENESDKDSHLIVAAEGDKVVGFCVVEKGETENKLYALYIHPDHQNKGIGKKLAENALRWLANQKAVSVNVADYNERAIGFYKKLGFQDVKEEVVLDDYLRVKSGHIIPERKMIKKAGLV